MRWFLLSLVLVSCANDDVCTKPREVTYSCLPVTASSSTCSGGPLLELDVNNVEVHADPDQSFPTGCDAVIGQCDRFQSCRCEVVGSAAPAWNCPL